MKIQLFLAIQDSDYCEHLSNVLQSKYFDNFAITVCSSASLLPDMLRQHIYDVAVFDADFLDAADNLETVHLPLLLWTGADEAGSGIHKARRLQKYQRISSMVSEILAWYAEISGRNKEFGSKSARVSVVWSPAGGSGKTTVAIAYAAFLAGQGKKTVYLNLEPFSSSPQYFRGQGAGLSSVFEKMQDRDRNTGLMLQSIRLEDSGSGIFYFNPPDNYEDISILTPEDTEALIKGAASDADEVIVDTGSYFSQSIRQTMERADQVLLVTDSTGASQVKLLQFQTQHSVYEKIEEKVIVIANRGASLSAMPHPGKVLVLPVVNSGNPLSVYKTLSSRFEGLPAQG